MSYISTSEYFFYSPYSGYPETKSIILGQLLHIVSRFSSISAINLTLMAVFLLNSVSLIFYLFKIDAKAKIKKYISLACILLISMVLVLFAADKSFSIMFNYENLDLKFKIINWIPKTLEFYIPAFYLLGAQIYIINKVKSIKLNKKLVIFGIYITSLIFLTEITFCQFSMDSLLEDLRLKTCASISGDIFLGETFANIDYYTYYVLALTLFFAVIFGISELFSKKRRKQQTLKA